MHHHHQDALGAGLAATEAAAIDRRQRLPLAADSGAHLELTSPNDDAPGVQAEGVRANGNEHRDSGAVDGLGKALATMKAQLALRGFSLHDLSDGSFLACRWGYSRPLMNANAVHAFLRQIGGAA